MSQTDVEAMNVAQRIAVAELKRRFQKEEGCSRTNGSITKQELLPNSVRKLNIPKAENVPSTAQPPSETASFKERMQQFNQSPPIAKKAAPFPSPKKTEPRIVSAVSKKAPEDAKGVTSQEVDAKKIRPAVVSRTNAKSPLLSSPCRSPCKSTNGHGEGNSVRVPTPDPVDVQDSPGITRGATKIRPNPSHLSSLITEIQQQQQFVQNKQGDAKAKVSSAYGSSPPVPPVPPPRVPATGSPTLQHHSRKDSPRTMAAPHPKWRQKSLPSLAQLGPPPSKPKRPPKVRLGSEYGTEQGQTPPLPQRNPTRNNTSSNVPLQKPTKPVPPPPGAPSNADQRPNLLIASNKDNPRDSVGASSPIPEFTEEEELAGLDSPDDLYDDTGPHTASSIISNATSSTRTSFTLQADELYQDASLQQFIECDELYEDVGTAEAISSEQGSLINAAKKEEDRKKKEFERKLKKQQKEIEKRQKDIEKQNKKFNLTGSEVAVEMGVIKEATKGWRKDDLTVRKGETISILKISDTPVGKWLVRNEDGKVGYVDLTNIEVDANSIRYVMTQAKPVSQVSSDEYAGDDSLSEIYDDGMSEAIYEEL